MNPAARRYDTATFTLAIAAFRFLLAWLPAYSLGLLILFYFFDLLAVNMALK